MGEAKKREITRQHFMGMPIITVDENMSDEEVAEFKHDLEQCADSGPVMVTRANVKIQLIAPVISINDLAQALHEANKEAVEHGYTDAAESLNKKTCTFLEWNQLTENARDGRRIQAHALLEKYIVAPRKS